MSILAVNSVTDANGGNTATINSMTPTADSLQGFRNRIINGDMRIDQRNAGASVTQLVVPGYCVDRWNINGSVTSKFTAQRSTTAPSGFTNSLLITSSAATTVNTNDFYYLMQGIEGFNVADLGWGAAGAKTVTLSFWVRSSLTGTFGGALRNLIAGANRSYPFTYTVNAANTYEYKTVTVAGDTSGTWATDNSNSLTICFSFGAAATYNGTAGAWAGSNLIGATGGTNLVSTNGATFYITGVQLEVGSTATPFERRDYGRELFLCQRYFWKIKGSDGSFACFSSGLTTTTTSARHWISFPASMRSAPTITYGGTIYSYDGINLAVTSISVLPGLTGALIDFTGSGGGGSVGRGAVGYPAGASTDFIQAAIEL